MLFDAKNQENRTLLATSLWRMWIDARADVGRAIAERLVLQLSGTDIESLSLNARELLNEIPEAFDALRRLETEGEQISSPPWVKKAPAKWSPESTSDDQKNGWFVFLYGDSGLGKSTWASLAPKPFFLDLENGLKFISPKVKKSNIIDSVDTFQRSLAWCWGSDYETIVIDTMTKVEKLFAREILEKNTLKSLAADFGRGYAILTDQIQALIDEIQLNVTRYGKNVILLGHCAVGTAPNPNGEAYERYVPDMYKKVINHISSQVDACLMAYLDMFVKQTEQEDYIAKVKDAGSTKLLCGTSANAICKNRFGLKNGIEMNKEVFDIMNSHINKR